MEENHVNRMIVAVFGSESAASDGLRVLKDLHWEGDITLYATAVIAKDASGKVNTKQAADEGPIGTALGMLTGGLIGLMAGPIGAAAGAAAASAAVGGAAVGASLGGLTGMLFDLEKTGIDHQFVDDVARILGPGKTAVLADVDESWTAPLDTRMATIGGTVHRRLRYDVAEDQAAREAAAYRAEIQQLKDDLAQARAEDKAAIQKQIDSAKGALKGKEAEVRSRIEVAKAEADAKVAAMQNQLKSAHERHKAKIEKRIAEVKAEHTARKAKLQQANELIKEALTV
jgi:uncharacterized membrane protein